MTPSPPPPQVREYTDPSCDKLLPDLPPELRGRVKTVVLDLEDVLVHREWTRAKGWSIYKRPGAADFLLQVGASSECSCGCSWVPCMLRLTEVKQASLLAVASSTSLPIGWDAKGSKWLCCVRMQQLAGDLMVARPAWHTHMVCGTYAAK